MGGGGGLKTKTDLRSVYTGDQTVTTNLPAKPPEACRQTHIVCKYSIDTHFLLDCYTH